MSLSPDGKWALALRTGPPPRLVLLPTGAGDSIALPRGKIETYWGGRWLPDGKRILVFASEAGEAGRARIQDVRGGAARATDHPRCVRRVSIVT